MSQYILKTATNEYEYKRRKDAISDAMRRWMILEDEEVDRMCAEDQPFRILNSESEVLYDFVDVKKRQKERLALIKELKDEELDVMRRILSLFEEEE